MCTVLRPPSPACRVICFACLSPTIATEYSGLCSHEGDFQIVGPQCTMQSTPLIPLGYPWITVATRGQKPVLTGVGAGRRTTPLRSWPPHQTRRPSGALQPTVVSPWTRTTTAGRTLVRTGNAYVGGTLGSYLFVRGMPTLGALWVAIFSHGECLRWRHSG